MNVEQGLKPEEAIDFLRERLSSISARVSKLSTDVCAILEFVRGPKKDNTVSAEDVEEAVKKELEGPGKLMGKRAMHKKGRQKYDIWLGEIKCDNVKCEMSRGSTFNAANRHLFRMGGYQGQNSVLLFCCAVLLFLLNIYKL